MASLKAEKPCCTQPTGQVKMEHAKPTETTPKAPASKSKPGPKKSEQKSQPKKKVCNYAYN